MPQYAAPRTVRADTVRGNVAVQARHGDLVAVVPRTVGTTPTPPFDRLPPRGTTVILRREPSLKTLSAAFAVVLALAAGSDRGTASEPASTPPAPAPTTEPEAAIVDPLNALAPEVRTTRGDVWPDLDARVPFEIDDEERGALEAMYGAEDVRGWISEGAYLGWRIGIDAEGVWVFLIAGD